MESGDITLISAEFGLVPRTRLMPRATAFSGAALLLAIVAITAQGVILGTACAP
jgi:hypothetical protein